MSRLRAIDFLRYLRKQIDIEEQVILVAGRLLAGGKISTVSKDLKLSRDDVVGAWRRAKAYGPLFDEAYAPERLRLKKFTPHR